MTLIWSSPKSAGVTRLAYEMAITSARIDVTRVKRPIVEKSEDSHRDHVHRPDPPVRHQKPERIGSTGCLDVIASRIGVSHAVDEKKSPSARPQTACV